MGSGIAEVRSRAGLDVIVREIGGQPSPWVGTASTPL
jgi:hypothetical protein